MEKLSVINLLTWLVMLLLFSLTTIPLTADDLAEDPYVFLQSWGGEIEQFNFPTGIAVGVNGSVYVADTDNHRIQKFSLDGAFLTHWGSEGNDEGQFASPTGIAVDENGNVYVADTNNHRIQKFSAEGTFLTQWGDFGSEVGQFDFPAEIDVDGSGNIYVADTANNRIQKFSADGNFLTQWGSLGSGEGQFNRPMGIAVDASGNVYVADTDNHRIQKFAPTYPEPDPVYGLTLNGSFEDTPDLAHWTYGGNLPVSLVNDPSDGVRAARLAEPVPQTERPDEETAWLLQTIYVRPEWERPILTFDYRMFTNDILDFSDFHVWLTRSNGAFVAEILRDGFRACDFDDNGLPLPPPPGYDLTWRSVSFDLSPFKDQVVRIVFENRNLHANFSWGIWTYVDNVRVLDAGPRPEPPGPHYVYLPIISRESCDSVPNGLTIRSSMRTTQLRR